jgi:hypothetical protein
MEQMDSMSYLDLPTMSVLLAIAAGLPPPIKVRTDHRTLFSFEFSSLRVGGVGWA